MEFVRSRKDLSYADLALSASGQGLLLSNGSVPLTAFLPTNTAFDNFAFSLGLKNVTELSQYLSMVVNALFYHLIPASVVIKDLPINASAPSTTTFFPTRLGGVGTYGSLGIRVPANGSVAAAQVVATSSVARLLAADVPAGAGRVNVVDTVLQYWYPNLQDALLRIEGLQSFRSAINQAGLWPAFANGSSPFTLIAPTNFAIDAARSTLGMELSGSDAASADVMRYHVVPQLLTVMVGQRVDVQLTTMNGKNVSFASTLSGDINVTSPVVKGGPVAKVLGAPIPVGVGPTSYIYPVDQVLIPAYTSIYQCLTNDPAFAGLATLFTADSTTGDAIRDPKQSRTLLAPTPAGISKFAAANGRPDGAAYISALLGKNAVLKTHVVTFKALTASDLRKNATLDTLQGAMTLNTYDSANGPVVRAAQSGATVVSPNNVSILYGRQYIHSIDYVLVPSGVSLDAPGAASAAAPSLLLLAAALLAGRLLLAGAH
ncbi:hypothetical protein GPECTOR_9g730 [Gonium pectorale]|uniref:FAS1 domain-containing protein n=1 Tax=Gonium pectorale TaxID=33097 RepID=A0A150GSD3_GONPE|nr:hypothetical protein GPECTOR_9g730 [Gonium pectorale]|eukprot:KXZ52684.1 hypothetical protein GPECTOR_9g730 [Gonium pectorale]